MGDNGGVETGHAVPNRDEVIRALAGARARLAPFHVQALFVFGSVARDEASARSDVDLLVDFDEAPTLFAFARLRRVLAEILGRPVDLVTRPALKPQFRESILREAVRAA
jgi:predicted nucleotidyltransferase